MLEEFGLHGTFYLTAGLIGTDQLLWFDRAVLAYHGGDVGDLKDLCRGSLGARHSSVPGLDESLSSVGSWVGWLKQLDPESRGRLVEVNDTHQFVVVDKGSLDGVRIGMVFDIVRGTSTVGRAKAVRVRSNLAACDVMRSRTRGTLQVGDVVMQRGP